MLPSKQIAVSLLNALLRREDWALKKTRLHAGKLLRLNLASLSLLVTILPSGEFELSTQELKPNVTLTLSDDAMRQIPQLWNEYKNLDDIAAMMHIEGEAGLAQLVSDLAQNLRWDIEAELNQLLGPFMASLVISGFKKAQSLGQQLGQKGLAKTKDFLSQDYHVIVQRPVVDALKEDVQSLSQSLHRLEQRIQKLQKV